MRRKQGVMEDPSGFMRASLVSDDWFIPEAMPAGRGQAGVYNAVMELSVSPDHSRESDIAAGLLRPIPAGSKSEHMMLVSPNFDILMLHPAFEAIWHRPASTFLGRKCYHEIEKRDAPCPHCPGVVALRTGTVTEVETCAVLDDGTRVPFVLRAFPIYGVNGEPAGFVENCENISGRKRGEEDARLEASLTHDLLDTSSTSRVLRLGLDAALRLEGAESGCVLNLDPESGARELVAQRGVVSSEIEALGALPANTVFTTPEEGSVLVCVPIVCHSRPVAELVVRFGAEAHTWASSQFKLETIASLVASAIVRIQAEHLRGEAGLNIETIVSAIPLPTLFLDARGIVTIWNVAAERVFGRSRHEVIGKTPPFVSDEDRDRFFGLVVKAAADPNSPPFAFDVMGRGGTSHDVYFRAESLRDVMGNGTAYLLIATAPLPAEGVLQVGGDLPTDRTDTRDAPQTRTAAGREAVAAARALGQLFEGLSRGLEATTRPEDVAFRAAREDSGSVGRESMTISWTQDGALDIRFCPPAPV
jgi:PAS domain S-box-containing protein